MECVANFEVKSEGSVVDDDRVLRIKHPSGRYRARIQNIPRSTYEVPFLLSLHLYFEAPDLRKAKDIADEHLADCLNMLAFTTGLRFRRHRIRQIVDAGSGDGMRSLLMWTNTVENEDPRPVLDQNITQGIERLLAFDLPQPIKRAMRWYRLGVTETVPDDQFMNFWFALEIIAEFKKPSEKVPDRCPKCRAPLYCEACKEHPTHRRYAKQAIRELLKAVDSDCDDATVDRLDKTRNSLMHGSTLREIEDSLPQPHEDIVDVLGRLVWRAIVHQFPPAMFDGTLAMLSPSTYVHRTVYGVAEIQTIVPKDGEGDFDLRFTGMKVEMVSDPPQSARGTAISITPQQHERLARLSYRKSDHKGMLERILRRVRKKNDTLLTLVLATDMAVIRGALNRDEKGEWQDLFREILEKPAAL